MQRTRMFMSGIEMPGLGSVKDKVLRKFMTHETLRKLKSDQLMWVVAAMSAGQENKTAVKKIWEELIALEIGGESPESSHTPKDDDEVRWLAEYEAMKARDVKLVSKKGKLSVEGL